MSRMLLTFSGARIQTIILVLALAFLLCNGSGFAGAQEPVDDPTVAEQTNFSNGISLKDLLAKYEQRGREKWESHIQKLEQQNQKEKYPNNALLFFGSSSFRLWESMPEDMAPYPCINRGYGGAKFVDMVLFAERMLAPHQYRALMLFAANDVTGEPGDSSPREVESALREIIRISQAHMPDAPIFIVEVTPTEKRIQAWNKSRRINAVLREVALSTDNCWYITTAEHYLSADGQPRPEFFVDDKLHLNKRGYRRWSRLIKRSLNQFLPQDVPR